MSAPTKNWAMGIALTAGMLQSCARSPMLDDTLLFSKQGFPSQPAMRVNGSPVYRVAYAHHDNKRDIETVLFMMDDNRNLILEPPEIHAMSHLEYNIQDQTYISTSVHGGIATVSILAKGKMQPVDNIIIRDPITVGHIKDTILSLIIQPKPKSDSPGIQ